MNKTQIIIDSVLGVAVVVLFVLFFTSKSQSPVASSAPLKEYTGEALPIAYLIPLVLTTFPTPFGASVFIIALAVWFPVQLMTSSGIQNTSKVYFEVGKTLGAKTFTRDFGGKPSLEPPISRLAHFLFEHF